jgi:hypothetical protein
LLNAERFREPYGAPAIHLASEARAAVLAAASHGTAARLVAHSTRTPVQGHNLLVAMHGRDRERSPVVIMTPRSSWWQSTAERGGGIVCWLEALCALIAAPPACDVVFAANSGHELGHLGLDDFLARRPGWERRATWLHFGANLGAAGGNLSVMSASDDLRALAAAALSDAGRKPDEIAPQTAVPSGETRISLTPAGATSPWSAAIHGSTCRRTAGRTPSMRLRSRASPPAPRGWPWR